MSALHEKEAEARLDAYRKSALSSAVSYDDLEQAWQRDQMALDVAPNDAAALRLKEAILAELGTLTEKGQAELHEYEQALSAQKPGYMHLAMARQLAGKAVAIDPQFKPAQSLSTKIASETGAIEASIKQAQSFVSSQKLDEALASVAKYRCFAGEEPRIADVFEANYQYHLGRARTLEGEQKWREAAEEYDKAAEVKKSPELVNSANRNRATYKAAQDKIMADAAVQRSMEYEADRNYIDAYEILAVLPDSERALVTDRMVSLEEAYIKSAVQEAKRLEDAHTPIKGKRDEMEVQRAYEFLKRVNALEDDRDLKVRLDLLAQTLSDYYVQQAKRYLDKPLGSGIGVAWIYLDKAQQYRANRDDIRDERTRNASLHDMRSTLSIGVSFRDQTSQRDSTGFAALLSDAIATGLGTSELPITIVRSGEEFSPNFRLVGDVIQHRATSVPTIEPMQSKYRAAMRELPNEDWNRANGDYQAAKVDLESAQRVLEGAQARGKKNDIAAAGERVSLAKKRVLETGQKLDSIPRTLQSDVIRPYTYVKKTYNLSAVVELAARIEDAGQRTVYALTPIKKSASKAVVVLENVKAEDTEGVKPQGTQPDETQLLTDAENEARDALIKQVGEKVQELPVIILARARQDLTNGDLDGAAECYILYLNSTPGEETKDRIEAKRFLQDQFNISQDQFKTSKVANSGS
ncbi:MAG: hypothetical protein JOZ14_01050 [Acidobacteria bacterium]|nr:hypothetical protein [Acidobacteriota bacterium]